MYMCSKNNGAMAKSTAIPQEEEVTDQDINYYKPRYVDLQIKFSVDPATNEIIQTVSCGRKIPPRYIGYPRHMTRDQLLEELKEEKKNVSLRNTAGISDNSR